MELERVTPARLGEKQPNLETLLEGLSELNKRQLVRLIRVANFCEEIFRLYPKINSFYCPSTRYVEPAPVENISYSRKRGYEISGMLVTLIMAAREGVGISRLVPDGVPVASAEEKEIHSKLVEIVKQEVQPEDFEIGKLLPILKESYRQTAEALLTEAERFSPLFSCISCIKGAKKLANIAGFTLNEERISRIEKKFHTKRKREYLTYAQKIESEGADPVRIMITVAVAVESAEFLGEDLSFAKKYARLALPAGLKNLKEKVKFLSKKPFFLTVEGSSLGLDGYRDIERLIQLCSRITGINIEEELAEIQGSLDELIKREHKRSKSPFWKRPFVR